MRTIFAIILSFTVTAFASADPTFIKAKQVTSITLSPHLTELVFSAGGEKSLVGISAYSNYPAATKNITIIGDAFRLDYELIKTLNPDVIFYWKNGTANQVIQKLEAMDLTMHEVDISQLKDIPAAIKKISKTLKTKPLEPIELFYTKLAKIKNNKIKPQSALIQVSNQPIYTVNGQHWMSEAIKTCGLSNVFNDLTPLSAAVTLESVLIRKPEVIVRIEPLLDSHQLAQWESIPAIANQQIVVLDADQFTRPTLRILNAIESLCEQINQF